MFYFADLIVKLIHDVLKVKKVVIIGHSFGGMISTIISAHEPDLVMGVSQLGYGSLSPH